MGRTRRAALVGAVVSVVVGFGLVGHAQGPAQPPNLRIVTIGGFLGYVDGNVIPSDRDPSALGEAWGGLFGVERWLREESKKSPDESAFIRGQDLLLITGNNLALDSRNQQLSRLSADAVALSIDDFLRSLRDEKQAARFVHELTDAGQPPFVVSNAIVRIHKKELNSKASEGLTLEIPRDESVGWLNTLRVTCRTCPEKVTAILTEVPAAAKPRPLTATATRTPDRKHITIAVDRHLRPERRYTLTLSSPGRRPAAFSFQTHVPLTRLTSVVGGDVPVELRGLPMGYATRNLEQAPKAGIVIVGMVDPGTKALLGSDRWRWTSKDIPNLPCGGDECEIDFLPAADAFAAIRSQIPIPQGSPGPVFVLMSGLTDPQTLALVSGAPEIRFVLLDPDSSTLGQDRGNQSVVNNDDAETAQIWARPPWIGAEADILSAHMAWDDTKYKQKAWLMTSPRANVTKVRGEKLVSSVDGSTGQIEYRLRGAPEVRLGGPYAPYPRFPRIDASTSPGSLWVTQQGTAALVLDVMRRTLAADIAVLPAHFIDRDIVAWLAAEAAKEPLSWLSRFILAKALYKMEHIVTVAVDGARLADVLDAVVKAQAQGQNNPQIYAAGLGAASALAIDREHLRVNGRAIVPTHVYKVTMPQSLAEAQKLRRSRASLTSMLDTVDARILRETEASLSFHPLGEQLDREFAQRPRVYFSVTPAHFEYHRASVTDPDKAFANIPLAGRAVKAERQWAASGFADVGVDLSRVAGRLTFDGKYAKKTVGDVVTNPNDEWTLGPRFDYKVEQGAFDRFFAGVFHQTWFSHHVEEPIKPSFEATNLTDSTGATVAKATVTGADVTARIEKPSFRFLRIGADFRSATLARWITLRNVTAAYDWGKASKDREEVSVAGITKPVGEYFKSPKTFLSDLFRENPGVFLAPQQLAFRYASRRRDQQRIQLDGSLEIKPPVAWTNDMKLTTTVQYRHYMDEETRPAFTANTSLDLQTKFEWTVVNRLKMGPFVNIYRVKAKGASGTFKYRDYGFGIEVPLFVGLNPARLLQ